MCTRFTGFIAYLENYAIGNKGTLIFVLDKSINNPGTCLHHSSIKESCLSKEAGRNPRNQIYPSVDSLSDLESIF